MYTYIYISVMQHFKLTSITDVSSQTFMVSKNAYHYVGQRTTEFALKHPDVQQFLRNSKKKYDLILVEQWYQDAFLMLSHQFKAPVVSICELL